MLKAFEHIVNRVKEIKEERNKITETGVVTAIDCQLVPDMGGQMNPYYIYTITMEDGTIRLLKDHLENSGVTYLDLDIGDVVNYNSRGKVVSILPPWEVEKDKEVWDREGIEFEEINENEFTEGLIEPDPNDFGDRD